MAIFFILNIFKKFCRYLKEFLFIFRKNFVYIFIPTSVVGVKFFKKIKSLFMKKYILFSSL